MDKSAFLFYTEKQKIYSIELKAVSVKIRRFAWFRFFAFVFIFAPAFVFGIKSWITLTLTLLSIIIFFFLVLIGSVLPLNYMLFSFTSGSLDHQSSTLFYALMTVVIFSLLHAKLMQISLKSSKE